MNISQLVLLLRKEDVVDTTTEQGARILLAHPHPIMIEGLKRVIARRRLSVTVVGEAYTPFDTRKLLIRDLPDGVVMTASWGLNRIKQIRQEWPKLKMLVLRDGYEIFMDEWVLMAGADGHVRTTDHGAEERIEEAIKRVMGGGLYIEPQIASRIFSRMVGRPRGTTPILPPQLLSLRELEVFELLGEGKTGRQIGQILRLAPLTVASYRENLQRKLELKSFTELTACAVAWLHVAKDVFS